MARNPFLFSPMEPGGSSSSRASAAGSDPAQPSFLHPNPNPVLFVPPLRVVAPPGVPPFLPRSFDPHFVFNALRADLFPRAASFFHTPNSSDFDRVRNAASFADLAGPASRSADEDRASAGNGIHASWNGASSKGDRFAQARSGFDINAPAPSSSSLRYFGGKQASDGLRVRDSDSYRKISAKGNGFAPVSKNGNSILRAAAANSSKSKASSAREPPFGRFKSHNMPDLQVQGEAILTPPRPEHSAVQAAEAGTSKVLLRHEGSESKRSAHEIKRRRRELRSKRSAASKRPATDGLSGSHLSPHRAVTYTLRLYDALRRNSVHEEEGKSNDASKGGRPDLYAGSVINSKGLAVNRSRKVIGPVPGIEIGTLFFFRMELCCVGLHGPIQAGIDYITEKESEHEHKASVAISIISSGGYDAKDNGEELVYTGQGGKGSLVSKQVEDQKLERGNLAMKGSMRLQVPVRVSRGIKDSASPSGKTYTYDGLYLIEECWSEKGKFGFEEFKFRLRRCPGQPELGSARLKLSNTLKYRPGEREGLCLPDVANGKEGTPVCVVNTVDSALGPPPFDYSTSLQYPHEASLSQPFGRAKGCDCEGVCSPSQSCSCFEANRDGFPYLGDGILVKEKEVIFECGSNCQCTFNCKNRLTQRAIKYRLEIFKTEDRGWGLRSWDTIPAGSFICEYTGKFVQTPQFLQTRDFVLDLRRLPKSNAVWGDVSSLLDIHTAEMVSDVSRPDFIIDSSQTGNAARFINHSCSPNILIQFVYRDYQDTKSPHVMLFAMDNIAPFTELTINYGSDPPSVDYQVPGKQCLCKSDECKGIFYP